METPLQTANAQVYEDLRSQILSSVLLPGEWLREQDLVAQFNVSRTPIREALRRLESDQVVEIIPYRGARIVKPDAAAIRDEYIVRAALEGLAVELAVDHITDDVIARLETLASDMERILDEHNIRDYLSVNRQFHMTIYELAGAGRLLSMIRDAWDRDNIYRIMILSNLPAALTSEKQMHRKLIEALRERDGGRARELMQQSCFDTCELYERAMP